MERRRGGDATISLSAHQTNRNFFLAFPSGREILGAPSALMPNEDF
jgi:hypothetical protein